MHTTCTIQKSWENCRTRTIKEFKKKYDVSIYGWRLELISAWSKILQLHLSSMLKRKLIEQQRENWRSVATAPATVGYIENIGAESNDRNLDSVLICRKTLKSLNYIFGNPIMQWLKISREHKKHKLLALRPQQDARLKTAHGRDLQFSICDVMKIWPENVVMASLRDWLAAENACLTPKAPTSWCFFCRKTIHEMQHYRVDRPRSQTDTVRSVFQSSSNSNLICLF